MWVLIRTATKRISTIYVFPKIKIISLISKNYHFTSHYENAPLQVTAIFHGHKNDNFQMKNCDTFANFSKRCQYVGTR